MNKTKKVWLIFGIFINNYSWFINKFFKITYLHFDLKFGYQPLLIKIKKELKINLLSIKNSVNNSK
jgi:hypothetical protein